MIRGGRVVLGRVSHQRVVSTAPNCCWRPFPHLRSTSFRGVSSIVNLCKKAQHENHRNGHSGYGLSALVVAVGGLYVASNATQSHHQPTTSTSLCEASVQVRPKESQSALELVGVNEEDVDALVSSLLADKAVNIAMLPDRLEAQLYKNTIILTLNAIYSMIEGLQGTQILSHELKVHANRQDKTHTSELAKALTDSTAQSVNDEVLQQVAKRLLANPIVNSPWVPDALEEQVYVACLQVIFRVTQIILSTIKIRLCGHDIRLSLAFGNESWEQAAIKSADNAGKHKSTMTPVDLDLLKKLAHSSGVDDETNSDYFWNRLFTRSNFVEQLHVSLYGLVLGLLDDLFLGQLQVQVLSDTIGFDLVPAQGSNLEIVVDQVEDGVALAPGSPTPNSAADKRRQAPMMVASYILGMASGVALMAIVGSGNV